MIRRLPHRIKNSDFVRHVGTLASGTLLAQLIALAAAPVLTRLYGPESLAALAIFIALISTIAPAAAGRYNIALIIAEDQHEADGLLILALVIAGVCSLFMLAGLFFFHSKLSIWLNISVLGNWVYLAPFGLFLTVFVTVWKNHANFQKRYLIISKIVVLQTLTGVALSLILGWLEFKQRGLVIAHFSALLLSAVICTCMFYPSFSAIKKTPKNQLRQLAYKYREFPLINALPIFLSGFRSTLPIFFLAKYYPEAIVGYYALMTRVVEGPLGVISRAISQVNMKKTSELLYKGISPLMYFLQLSAILSVIAILPTIIVFLYGPELVSFFFGSQWREAGELLVILMPALAVRFVVSTLSVVCPATGNVRLGSLWHILSFVVTFLVFTFFSGGLEVREMFYVMLLLNISLYSLYYSFALWAVIKPKKYA